LETGTSGRLDARLVPPSGVVGSVRRAVMQDVDRQRAEGTMDGSFASWVWRSVSAPSAGHIDSDGGHASAWLPDRQWDFTRDWDWNLAWQQVREFLWEWRFPLAIFAAMVVAASSAPALGVVASSTAMASAPAASAPVAGLGIAGAAAATSWLPSVVAMLQLAFSAGSTAMPILTAAYAWQNRREIVAIIWILLGVLMLPTLVRSALRLWELWRCTASRRAVWGHSGAASPQCARGPRSDGRVQGEQGSQHASGKPKRRRPARSPPPRHCMEAGRWAERRGPSPAPFTPVVAFAGSTEPQEIVTVMGRTVLERPTAEINDETESRCIHNRFRAAVGQERSLDDIDKLQTEIVKLNGDLAAHAADMKQLEKDESDVQ